MIDTIICGDCLEVMPQIEDKSVDMVLADLPYGVTACKWDTPIDLDALWVNWLRICKGAIVLTGTQPFTSRLVMSHPNLFKDEWVWDKQIHSNFLHAKRHPLKYHENILVFSLNSYTYNPQPRKLSQATLERAKYKRTITTRSPTSLYPQIALRDGRDKTTGFPKSIISFKKDRYSAGQNQYKTITRYHNTQKPVALFEYLIRTYTNEGDTVLDPTCGSGTTAVACRESNRHYICIEKEPEYCAIAERRVKEML